MVSCSIYEMQKTKRNSSRRTITKFVRLLGRHEPSDSSTEELNAKIFMLQRLYQLPKTCFERLVPRFEMDWNVISIATPHARFWPAMTPLDMFVCVWEREREMVMVCCVRKKERERERENESCLRKISSEKLNRLRGGGGWSEAFRILISISRVPN